jgi:hypothetical protein
LNLILAVNGETVEESMDSVVVLHEIGANWSAIIFSNGLRGHRKLRLVERALDRSARERERERSRNTCFCVHKVKEMQQIMMIVMRRAKVQRCKGRWKPRRGRRQEST